MADETHRPVLRVVAGSPTPEELAVVAAVVAAAGTDGPGAPTARVRRGGWSDPSRAHTQSRPPGPNAWRAAAW